MKTASHSHNSTHTEIAFDEEIEKVEQEQSERKRSHLETIQEKERKAKHEQEELFRERVDSAKQIAMDELREFKNKEVPKILSSEADKTAKDLKNLDSHCSAESAKIAKDLTETFLEPNFVLSL